MWDDWRAIEAAQARADAEDAERYADNVVRFPTAPVEGPQGPETAVEPVPATPAPRWGAGARPERPRVDDARGLKLYAKLMRVFLER